MAEAKVGIKLFSNFSRFPGPRRIPILGSLPFLERKRGQVRYIVPFMATPLKGRFAVF